MTEIKVIVVDDHPIVRKGIRDMLHDAVDITVIGEASLGREALELVNQLSPDVLLLDMELPDISGNEVVRELKDQQKSVYILALSAYADKVYIMESLANGVAGYLVKDEVPENIIQAIRGVARGERGWVSRQVAARLSTWVEEQGMSGNRELTLREVEVLRGVVEGKTNQEIAFQLGISDKTVEKHLVGVFSKLGVNSRVEAAVHAIRDNLV